MSEPIRKDELVEDGVLDNILKPLDLLKKSLIETDAELKKFAETVKSDLSFSEKSKDLREFSVEEEKLNKAYERKKKLQDEQLKVGEEERKLRAQLAKLQTDEAKNLAALKAEISAQNKELRANATAVQNNTTAYKELERTTIAAKNQSKELGAQLLVLANAGKQNTNEYNLLSAEYAEATVKAAALDKQLKGLDKSVGDNQRNVGNYKSALEELDARVASGTLTMREMTKAIKEYQTIALQNQDIPEVYQLATAKAGALTDTVGDLRAETKALSSDTVNLDAAMSLANGAAGLFQAVEGFKALGVENDAVMESVQKLAAIQSIMNGLKAVEETINKSNIVLLKQTTIYQRAAAGAQMLYAAATGTATGATNAFRVALISTGIGAIIVGIGMLVANFDKVTAVVRNVVDWFGSLGEKTKLFLSILFPLIGAIRLVYAGLEKMGIIQTEQAEKAAAAVEKQQEAMMKLQEQKRKDIENALADNRRLQGSTGKYYDFEIAKAKAAGKDVYELEKEKRAEMIKTYQAQMKLIESSFALYATDIKKQLEMVKEMAKVKGIIEDIEQEDQLARIKKNTEASEKSAKTQEENEKKLADLAKKTAEMYDMMRTSAQKADAESLKSFNERYEQAIELSNAAMTSQKELKEIEILEVKSRYALLREEALKYGKDIGVINRAEKAELKRITTEQTFEQLKLKEDELAKENALLKKQNTETIKDETAFKKAEEQRELDHLKQLIKLRKKHGQDVTDLETQLAEKQRKTTEKNYSQSIENIANKVSELYNKSADLAIQSMQRQQEHATTMMNHFAGLAQNGNIEATQSMAAMIERQEEFQRKQEQMERRKLRMQRASQAGAILTKELESGKSVPEALASMGTFLAASEGLIPSFDVGTENTGSGYGYGIDGKGGFAAVLHPNEKVLNAKHTQMVGDISNQELAELGYKSRMGMLENGNSSHDLMILHNELKNIKKAIESQPQQIVGLEETLAGLVKLTVSTKKGNHINSTNYRS
jgi:hypothetical protein